MESSDDEVGTEDESFDEIPVAINDRRNEAGNLEYEIRYDNGECEWLDRSDLWDFGPMSKMVIEYDAQDPIEWDTVCAHCGSEFNSKMGCEECMCAECDRSCRHLQGVNYGCVKHPVL